MRSNLLQLFNDNYFSYTASPEGVVEETETAYQLTLDVAGIRREDLDIEVKNGVLVIKGERKGAKSYTFEKKFRLGDTVLVDEIKATHQDGVLTLELAKASKAQARKIAIAE